MSAPLLEYEGVSYCYPGSQTPALQGLNLRIEPHSVTAILGPNGAGKTTLLHLALGWLRAQSGTILWGGRPLHAYTRQELGQRMGLVPQSEHIPFAYSLLEFVLFGRSPYLRPLDMPGEADVHLALAALQRVGLGAAHDRSILALSGGERQLVLVARALAQQPRLLLLDEPSAHLDLGNKSRLVHLLQELAAQGTSILFTTHDPEMASSLASQLVLMQKGQVLYSGGIDEAFTGSWLSRLYQTPLHVLNVDGKRVVLWN